MGKVSFHLSSVSLCLLLLGCGFQMGSTSESSSDYPIQPVSFNEVRLQDDFWAPRIRLNHQRTIPYALQQSEETGRIRNFEIAAGLEKGDFCTIYPFDDSDVYKIIEGASYSLQMVPDPKLDAYLDQVIEKIAAAQEPDGYLYTNRTIMGDRAHEWAGRSRWELVHKLSHELYNLGHLYEAAVAHYQATGKTELLDVAVKSADLLVKEFGWGKIENYPGHQEVEIGLVKLYRATGRREFLDLVKFFLDVRGPAGETYSQSHQKVFSQDAAVGHAVRANYMYSAMADVAALTGDERYLRAIDRIWQDVVSSKIYVTGGVGSTSSGEAYGAPYQLPNLTAYCETCASIANVFWNHRMFLLHGEGKYLDVLERSLYNGVLSGLSLSGDRFFYPNPLQSTGQHERQAWFGCACCPSNLTRFLPSIPGYLYAQRDRDLFINLYAQSEVKMMLDGRSVTVRQETDFPWDGKIRIQLNPVDPFTFSVHLRVPGWTGNQVIASDLYEFLESERTEPALHVNGSSVEYEMRQGFAVLEREWNRGDEILLELPLSVRQIRAHPRVKDDTGRICLQRGPLVYALEWPDNPDGKVLNLSILSDLRPTYDFDSNLLGGVGLIMGEALRSDTGKQNELEPVEFKAIPYYAWANRGAGEMTVWIPEAVESRGSSGKSD